MLNDLKLKICRYHKSIEKVVIKGLRLAAPKSALVNMSKLKDGTYKNSQFK
jgi:hypothetical protein